MTEVMMDESMEQLMVPKREMPMDLVLMPMDLVLMPMKDRAAEIPTEM